MLTSEQQAITRILTQATQYRASDVHLVPGNPPFLRVDGKLVPLDQEPVVSADVVRGFVDGILSESQKATLERERDVHATVAVDGKLRFRLTAMYQKGTLSLDLRYIPDAIPTPRELGLPKSAEAFARAPHGLVLISGPYGAGRTTVLASLVNLINLERVAHILSIEQPIEFLFVSQKSVIEQREVGADVPTIGHALTLTDMEDVDVIAIGELDSTEDMRACVHALHSGKLIIATITADSAVQAIERLVNAFSPADQPTVRKELADALQGVLNLRLVPRVGGGRVLVAEVFTPAAATRAVIRDGQFLQLANAMQTSRQDGTESLDRTLAELVRVGDILPQDAEAVALDPASLRNIVSRG
ncbi:MAG: ATPase, T2SS/T4P/T4SS family [Patescibacteria group bacterium]